MMPHVWGARLHCVGARPHCVAATPLMAIQRLTRPLEVGPHVPRMQRPRPCPSPALRPRGLYHVLVAILTAVAVRERGQVQRRRGAPAAIAGSAALRNGRMCTTGMRLAKLHNDTKRNERYRNNTKAIKHSRSMRNSDNGALEETRRIAMQKPAMANVTQPR